MNAVRLPSFFAVAGAAAGREWLSHRLNRFFYAHVALVSAAGLLPLLTPGEALVSGAAWWLLHAVLYALSLSSLLLGLSSAHAEAEEFAWLLGQPVGVAPWLAGKAAALAAMVAGASLLLAAPVVVAGGASSALALTVAGAAGVSATCALAGLALGFWIRDSVRGLMAALGLWFLLLFGVDLLLLATAGSPFAQQRPDLWVGSLMASPLDAYRVTVLFTVERAAFSGINAGALTTWWVGHAPAWLAALLGTWGAGSVAMAWLGASRRMEG
ncbi:MAG TPA: hypothetical protein VGD81_19680 [Opitutaceae bacterium]